jgi:hypothetical protein
MKLGDTLHTFVVTIKDEPPMVRCNAEGMFSSSDTKPEVEGEECFELAFRGREEDDLPGGEDIFY